METIGVLCSGGDAPGMNAALRAVVRTAIFNGMRVYGIQNGFHGFIEGDVELMQVKSVSDILQRGGTVLGSARSKRFKTEEGMETALEKAKEYGLEGLVVLGGDGSYRGALALSQRGLKVVGIPCTIDNDMGYTRYTIGFFTAVETILDAVGKFRDTTSSHGRGAIIEVMGRHCGDLALYAGLSGGAEHIIVPEVTLNMDELCNKIVNGRKRGKKHQIILLAEGVQTPGDLARTLEERTGVVFRMTILGHIQRGGAPAAFDRLTASRMGSMAVELLAADKTDLAIGTDGHKLFTVSMEEAVKTPHAFDTDMYRIAMELSI